MLSVNLLCVHCFDGSMFPSYDPLFLIGFFIEFWANKKMTDLVTIVINVHFRRNPYVFVLMELIIWFSIFGSFSLSGSGGGEGGWLILWVLTCYYF